MLTQEQNEKLTQVGKGTPMGDGDQDTLDSQLSRPLSRFPPQLDRRCPTRQPRAVNIPPADSLGQPGPESLQHCFFHRPPPREVRRRVLERPAALLFVVRINAINEPPRKTFNHRTYARNFNDVNADADDLHVPGPFQMNALRKL